MASIKYFPQLRSEFNRCVNNFNESEREVKISKPVSFRQ